MQKRDPNEDDDVIAGINGVTKNPNPQSIEPEELTAGVDGLITPNQTSFKNDASNEKVVDSHPGTQPDELAPHLKAREAQVDKFGPEQEAQVMDSLRKGYQKPGFLASEGAAGLGDAIMQGVARAGSGNFLNTVERNKEQQLTQVPQEMKQLREGNLQGMKEKMALQQLNPNSTLNNIMKPGLKAGFQAAFPNMTPEQLETISSNPQLAEKLMPQLVEAEKAKGELAMKQLMLETQRETVRGNQALTSQARQNEEKRTQIEALKDTASHYLAHPFEASKARETLAKLGQGTPTLSSEDQTAISWAKANLTNPKTAAKAKKILSLHGMNND